MHNNNINDEEWKELKELASPAKRSQNWPELGRRLYVIERAAKGKGAFTGICEALKLAGRTGYYLAKIMRRLDGLQVDPPEGLEWTKIKDLVELINFENYGEVFERCITSTKDQLAQYMYDEIKENMPL